MRRVVVVVPRLLGDPEAESPLRQNLPSLRQLAEIGTIGKIAVPPRTETPEALLLGMRPDEAQMAQGPLTVSALGADPPDRSTHFHLSLLSLTEGIATNPLQGPSPEELEAIWTQVKRLDTKSLTLLRGESLDHGLVWEARGDLGTTPPRDVDGQEIRGRLPEGDGERILRRLIDDSVNLLNELELNQRRVDEGLPPLNLLWPWGQGERRPVPNLVLRRGERAVVESGSMRMAGLTRLTGYLHEDRASFGRGTNVRLRKIAERALARTVSIVVIDAVAEMRDREMEEELHWLVREMDRELLQPLLDTSLKESTRLTLLAPGPSVGLSLVATPMTPGASVFPFDERTLEERHVPTQDLWRLVESGVTL